MKQIIALFTLGVILVGCGEKAPDPAEEPKTKETAALPPGASGGDVTPMTPTPIPNAPVSGGTDFGGSSGSLGTAAKQQAKDVAGGQTSSLDGSGIDEEGTGDEDGGQ
jgi:hypothetical protein